MNSTRIQELSSLEARALALHVMGASDSGAALQLRLPPRQVMKLRTAACARVGLTPQAAAYDHNVSRNLAFELIRKLAGCGQDSNPALAQAS
jgi:hypothetical protein